MDFWTKIYPSFHSNTNTEANPKALDVQNCCKNHSQIPKNSKKTKNCFSYFRSIQSLRVIPIHCWRCKEPIAIKFACQSSRNLHKQFYGLKLFSIIAYHYSCIFNLFCGLLCVHRTHTKLLV